MAVQIYSLTISSNSAGQFAQNILHYKFDDAGFASRIAAAKALIDAWNAAALTSWRAMHPTDVTFLSIKSRCVSAQGGFEAVGILGGSPAGTRSGTQSASGIAPCMILFGLGATRVRGRIFLTGLSENDCESGVYTAAYKTAVAAAIDDALDDITLTGGGGPSASNVIFKRSPPTAITVYKRQLSDTVGTIRRRQRPA